MVVTDRANSESLSLHRLRERGYNWGGSVNEFDSKLGCGFRLFVRSEVFVFSSHVLCQVDNHSHRSEESYKFVRSGSFFFWVKTWNSSLMHSVTILNYVFGSLDLDLVLYLNLDLDFKLIDLKYFILNPLILGVISNLNILKT